MDQVGGDHRQQAEDHDDEQNDDYDDQQYKDLNINKINVRESVKNIHPNKNLEKEENLRCPYCGFFDTNFNNEDFVAIHYFKYCPMVNV